MGHGPLTRKGSRQTRELADWAHTSMLRPGQPLANAEGIAIPRCVGSVDETLANIRENRDDARVIPLLLDFKMNHVPLRYSAMSAFPSPS